MKNCCKYCKNAFEALRKNKRYCSNSCKQLAYMVRLGQAVGSAGARKVENVKSLGDQNIKTSMRQNVKPSMSQNVNTENHQRVETDHRTYDMNALLKELKGFIQATVNESLGKEMEKVKTSNSQNVKPLVADVPAFLDPDKERVDIEEAGLVEHEEDPEKEEKDDFYESGRQTIKPPVGQNVRMKKERRVKTSKSQNVMVAVALSEEPLKTEFPVLIKREAKKEKMEQTDPKSPELKEENKYVSYYPEFLEDIYDHFNLLGRDLLFLEKERSFPGKSKQVGWVSVRYRSLLETLLTLSEMNRVHLSDLVEVANAFTFLIRSRSYAELPGNYPYTASIKALREKLRALCVEYSDEESIRFRIPLALKRDLLLYRLELSQSFPKKAFCKLTFNE